MCARKKRFKRLRDDNKLVTYFSPADYGKLFIGLQAVPLIKNNYLCMKDVSVKDVIQVYNSMRENKTNAQSSQSS